MCAAIREVAGRLLHKDVEELFSNMGAAWDHLLADPQLRWIGPEKGVIHIASGAVNNALWDMFAKSRKKPLWKLVVDMSPVCLLAHLHWNMQNTNVKFYPGGNCPVHRVPVHLRRNYA